MGSFNQSNSIFGETAGKQCVCNSVAAIAWSTVKHAGRWDSRDLDAILAEGDSFYKSLKTDQFLSVSDIPENISIQNENVTLEKLSNVSGIMRTSNCLDMHNTVSRSKDIGSGFLFS